MSRRGVAAFKHLEGPGGGGRPQRAGGDKTEWLAGCWVGSQVTVATNNHDNRKQLLEAFQLSAPVTPVDPPLIAGISPLQLLLPYLKSYKFEYAAKALNVHVLRLETKSNLFY